MKKLSLLKSMLLLCALVAGSGSVWADESTATFDFDKNSGTPFGITGESSSSSTEGDITSNVSATDNGVTVTITPKSSGDYENRFWNKSPKLRMYSGTLTISAGNYNIKSIALTVGSGKWPSNTVNNGEVSGSSTSYTWTGSTPSVVFTIVGNTQIKKLVVTYDDVVALTPSKEYTTLTSAFNLNFTGISGLKAYIATGVGEGNVNMTQVNKVPAGTGLVLHKTSGTSFNVPVFDGTGADAVTSNKMAGSATATTAIAANGGYILKDGVFQPATAGTLAAGKAYLNIGVTSAHPLEMSFDNGEVTSIERLDATTPHVDGQYFNLAGQRVAQPTKGLYIVNGKKVIVK